jgi:hypothetical protein
MDEARALIDRQLECYNAHDLEGFCATYADDAKVYSGNGQEMLLDGKAAIRERYRDRFSDPSLRARIASRLVLGSVVVDYEEIFEGGSAHPRFAIVVYEVRSGAIASSRILK